MRFGSFPSFHRRFRLGATLVLTCLAVPGVRPIRAQPVPVASVHPESGIVLKDGTLHVGAVTVDLQQRRITVPGRVSLRTGRLAYLAVAQRGKTHESLFELDATPIHMHTALLLLGLTPELPSPVPREGGARPEFLRQGDEIEIFAEWEQDGNTIQVPVEELLIDRSTGAAMKYNRWMYTGSALSETVLAQQQGLPLIALWHDPLAFVNSRASRAQGYRGADLGIEARTERLPPEGTIVRLTLSVGGAGPVAQGQRPAASVQVSANPSAGGEPAGDASHLGAAAAQDALVPGEHGSVVAHAAADWTGSVTATPQTLAPTTASRSPDRLGRSSAPGGSSEILSPTATVTRAAPLTPALSGSPGPSGSPEPSFSPGSPTPATPTVTTTPTAVASPTSTPPDATATSAAPSATGSPTATATHTPPAPAATASATPSPSPTSTSPSATPTTHVPVPLPTLAPTPLPPPLTPYPMPSALPSPMATFQPTQPEPITPMPPATFLPTQLPIPGMEGVTE